MSEPVAYVYDPESQERVADAFSHLREGERFPFYDEAGKFICTVEIGPSLCSQCHARIEECDHDSWSEFTIRKAPD